MPSCIFCGKHVLPANAVKGEPSVCSVCRDVLDQYMESRAVEYMQEKLKEDLPGLVEDTISHWNGRAFVVKFEDKWNKRIEGQIKEIIADSLADIVKEQVAEALRDGLASLVSGARPLSRVKKTAKKEAE